MKVLLSVLCSIGSLFVFAKNEIKEHFVAMKDGREPASGDDQGVDSAIFRLKHQIAHPADKPPVANTDDVLPSQFAKRQSFRPFLYRSATFFPSRICQSRANRTPAPPNIFILPPS